MRHTLEELPESLDETYERILKEIKKPNRGHARRVLQCLVVAIRPLRVAELAEVLAVDFDDAEGIPRLNPDWRWEDQELALLSACSSLIAIVEAGHNDSEAKTDDDASSTSVQAGGSRVVQFSHFSVKEFLTSPRLATASGEVSGYFIDLEAAHTILAQACLGVLLQIQDGVDRDTDEYHPVRYAAEHWATHAQFGEVSSRLHKGMEYILDANKPHFKVWITLCDIDTWPNDDAATFHYFALENKAPAAPLYYAALCGFYDLVEHLITKNPQDVNTDGGRYVRPLLAALAGNHFRTAGLLRHNGADPHVRGKNGRSPLHAAAGSWNFEVVRILIEYDPADINAGDWGGWTPLHWASSSGDRHFKAGPVVRFLLDHGAGVNVQSESGATPLHTASSCATLEVVRLLLEHGADVKAKRNDGQTVLESAAFGGDDEVIKLLEEHGPE